LAIREDGDEARITHPVSHCAQGGTRNTYLTRYDHAQVQRDIAVIVAQLASSRPEHTVLTASVREVKGMLSLPAISDGASGEPVELLHRLPS
jgi:hypothetical protein